jgi:hypothetical protein
MKNKALVHSLFPELTSTEDLQALDNWESKTKKKKKKSIILPEPEPQFAEDFDIKALMDSAEDPITGVLRDLKIDDRDLPLAKNYYDFCFNIIGKDSNPPWARQLWTGAMLFGEVCPKCSNPKWLDVENVPKEYRSKDMPEHLQFLENGKCPKCKTGKHELIVKHNLRNYQELTLCWGQRSGKSETAANLGSYQTHRYLKFPKLSSMSQALQASTPLTCTFVSLTFNKAFSLLWTPFNNKISSSSWFQEYHAMLDYYGTKYGQELYRKKDVFLKYHHKGLHLYPSHPNGPILRGDTRFAAFIDELGLFPLPSGKDDEDEQSERANSDEAHKSLTNSLTTVQAVSEQLMKRGYNSVPGALMVGVSSPMSERDKVMRLLKESRTELGSKNILGIQLPTWEVNPYIERTTPIIALAYERNPEKAERDFGANPPRVHSTYIKRNLVESGIFVGKPNSHILVHQFDQPGEIHGKLERLNNHQFPTVLSIDAGFTNNAFAVASTYFDFNTGKTVVDCVLEIVPQQGRTINFNMVYQHVLLPLAKNTNCAVMLADRWNSLDHLHRMKDDRGLHPTTQKPITVTKQYSCKRKDFDFVVQLMADKSLVLPVISKEDQRLVLDIGVENFKTELVNKPVAHLMLQLVTIKDVNSSRPPEKGEGYTDDMARAMVLGVSKLHEPKVMEILKEWKPSSGPTSLNSPMPIYISRGGGGFPRIR